MWKVQRWQVCPERRSNRKRTVLSICNGRQFCCRNSDPERKPARKRTYLANVKFRHSAAELSIRIKKKKDYSVLQGVKHDQKAALS